MDYSRYYNIMPDGTVKQINPFTGNEVWAVPGRSARPSDNSRMPAGEILTPSEDDFLCSFCSGRYFETPPEKSRLVRDPQDTWQKLIALPSSEYFNSIAEFRCVPNLFEIVPLDYWKKNYGYIPLESDLKRLREYASFDVGMQHLRDIIAYKQSLSNGGTDHTRPLSDKEVLSLSEPFFAGCHELVIARHHIHRNGQIRPKLISSGFLTPEEHFHYFQITIDAMNEIVARNRYVRYVSIFQNWLRPAGASFDHLHKQLVGLDEWGASITRQVRMLQENPNAFNEYASNFAAMFNLVIAENDYALAFAGIGHRFPTIEIFSKSINARPGEHTEEELRGVSDLVNACHAAMGPEISCNEEWYYSPIDTIVKMPWHVLIKWRINVPAGFEGGTSIYINPLTPIELRDKMVPRLYELRSQGNLSGIRIAEECNLKPNMLEYHRM